MPRQQLSAAVHCRVQRASTGTVEKLRSREEQLGNVSTRLAKAESVAKEQSERAARLEAEREERDVRLKRSEAHVASVTAALDSWNAYSIEVSGAQCDCTSDGAAACQKNDLCLFVGGMLNKTQGRPFTPHLDDTGFDANCCAYCHEHYM